MIGRLAVMIAAVAIAGVASAVIVANRDEPGPDAWDPRVQDLVDFVEHERGHDFDHPVPVDFLTDEEYSELTRTDEGDLDEESRAELEQAEGQLRAFGLVSGDIDLFEAGNDLSDTGTLAYYDIYEKRIVVRGTDVDPELAVTLVHELTHALQDQIFGTGALDDPDATSGESFGARALAEGDAVRVEDAYVAGLSDEEQAMIDAATDEGLDVLDQEEIPEAMQAFFGLPYALGDPFLSLLDAEGGDDRIDHAFDHPPTTEEHLLDPFSYLDDDDPVEVDVPEADDGAEVLDDGDFGAASLFLVLAQRMDSRQALVAADGWGGDAYVTFERDGRACAVLDVVGDHTDDTAVLASALEAWASAGVAGSATVERIDDAVRLTTCDPGVDATVATGSSIGALTMVATRNYFVAEAVRGGADEAEAVCFGAEAIARFTDEELQAETVPADTDQRIAEAFAACR